MSSPADHYLERINLVIDYIEEHLDEPLKLERLARVAAFSPFHFHRLFKDATGETLREFVGRVRLERAAKLIRTLPDATLTELAFRVGFSSSSDFSRSFKKHFGCAPRDLTDLKLRENRKIRKALEPDSTHHLAYLESEYDGSEYEVEVATFMPMPIAYIRIINPIAGEVLAEGLDRLLHWAAARELWPGATLVGLSQDDPNVTPIEKYRYDIAISVPEGTRGAGEVGTRVIPGGQYARVRTEGDIREVERCWTFLFKHWLLRSRWQPTDHPCLEVFLENPAAADWRHFSVEGRIPVKPL